MGLWKPNPTEPDLEKKMEELEVSEGERDEVRRFGDFLRRRKKHKAGEALPPAPEGMRSWLLGEDKENDK